jgi:hypothetical protein
MPAGFLTTKHAKATKNGKRINPIRVDIIFSFLRGLRELRGSRACSYFGSGFAALHPSRPSR